MLIKIRYCLVILLFTCISLYSQAPRGEIGEYIILDNLDTLNLQRQHTDCWFGVNGGTLLGISFNDLYIPEIFKEDGSSGNKSISYNSGSSKGVFMGLYGEWLPVDEMWGITLKMNFEYRSTYSQSNVSKGILIDGDTVNYYYKNTANAYYINFSPAVRYNMPIENLYAFFGCDLEFRISDELLGKKEFENIADIDHDKILPMNVTGFRVAFNAGIGYELFAADINRKLRAYISPYASVHIGSSEISQFGSSRIPFIFKLGANIRFNFDECKYDTLPLNTDYIEPPFAAVGVKRELGVDFAISTGSEYISVTLAEIPKRIIEEARSPSNVKADEGVKVQPKLQQEAVKKNISINPNSTKIFNYASTDNSTINRVDKEWLDALYEYLLKNPNATVRINGHSDDAGSTEQNQKRSEIRAAKVVDYLIKKGVSRRRLLDRGNGALKPIADNKTEKGRARNRRVEIQIVQ